MLPLCSLGIQRGDYSRNANNYSYRVYLESVFKMSGKRCVNCKSMLHRERGCALPVPESHAGCLPVTLP